MTGEHFFKWIKTMDKIKTQDASCGVIQVSVSRVVSLHVLVFENVGVY